MANRTQIRKAIRLIGPKVKKSYQISGTQYSFIINGIRVLIADTPEATLLLIYIKGPKDPIPYKFKTDVSAAQIIYAIMQNTKTVKHEKPEGTATPEPPSNAAD